MKKSMLTWVSALFLVLASSGSFADVTLDLTRVSPLTNVDDAEGRWQYDGGTVSLNKEVIGSYIRTKRISFGNNANVGGLTIHIQLNDANGPTASNLTLHGLHSFTSGVEEGSVSAATKALKDAIGLPFTGTNTAITVLTGS